MRIGAATGRRCVSLWTAGWAAAAAGLLASAARGAEQDPPWSITLRPSLWRPGLAGDVETGPASASVRRLGMDDPDVGFTGELELRRADMTLRLGGFSFRTTGSGVASSPLQLGNALAPAGGRFTSEAALASAQLTVGAQRRWTLGRRADLRSVDLALELYAGARFYDARVELDPAGGRGDEVEGLFLEPIVGARMSLDVLGRASLRFGADAGAQPFGDHTSASLDLQTAFTFWPTPSIEVFVGWRQIVVDLERSGEALDLSLAGLFFGASLSF